MRASAFSQPDLIAADSKRSGWPLIAAAVFLVLHLPFLAPALEDIDSINFALGLHDFDIAQHQPHPPGYPIYILLGRISLWLVITLTDINPVRADALALAVLSALGGALAILGAARLFSAVERRFGGSRVHPALPVALMAAAPLFWMCGLRPMSDMPGLAAVLWSQALLVEGMSKPRALVAGALLAGLAGGIRVQTLALTMPFLLLAIVSNHRAGLWWLTTRPGLATTGGVLAWAIPLVVMSGGWSGYLASLNTQAGEDFAFVNMLWTNPTLRRLAFSLNETFAMPWALPSLAQVVAVAGTVGGIVALLKTPRAFALVLFGFGPYLVYHLLFQETLTVRYALPLIPLVAWFATRVAILARSASVVVGGIVVFALVVAVGGGVAYGREPHPAYRALADATRQAAVDPPAKVFAHFGLRRSLQHGGTSLPFVEPRRQYEWLGPVDYWREGGAVPVWFFADPKRTDLALIDPASRQDVVRYGWSVASRGELAGTRPIGVDWYRLRPPLWALGEGWSLSPEAGGVTRATSQGLDHRPIEGWVRRRRDPMQLMIGGLHLGNPGGPDGLLRLSVEGSELDAWTVKAGEPPFLRFIALPDGIPMGNSPYASLRVEDIGRPGNQRPEIAIRQFDIRPASEFVWGFGEGWYEAEYQPETGAMWRWTSERAVLQLRGTPQPLTLTVVGESPLKYFDVPPTVRVTSQGRTLREFRPATDFELRIELPPDIWRDGAAAVAIESDRVYLPGQVEGTGDTRRLGLRLFDARIDTRLP